MDDNINQNQEAESIISDEELDFDLDLNDTEDVDALKAQLEREREARKQLTARAKAAEAKAKTKTSTITNKEQPKDFFEDERFDLYTDGYQKDEIKFIMANGGKKILQDPNSLVSMAIKVKQEQRAAERAASQTADNSGSSEIERKYSKEMLENMSLEELSKIVPRA